MARSLRRTLSIAVSAAAGLAFLVARVPSADAIPPPCPIPPPPVTIHTTTTVTAPNVTFPGTVNVVAAVPAAGHNGTLTISVDGIGVAAGTPGPIGATVGPLNVGPHVVQASYGGITVEPPPLACSGGTIYTASSAQSSFLVLPQPVATTMTVGASAADSTQPVKLAVHVGSAPAANAGVVTFLLAGHTQIVQVDAAGNAAATFAPLPAGSHTASVSYSGGLGGNYTFAGAHVDLVVPISGSASASAGAGAGAGAPTVTSTTSSTGTTGAGSSTGTIGAPAGARRAKGARKQLRIRYQDNWAWTTAPDATQMSRLLITSAPAASRVQVTCAGGRCPQRKWERRGVSRVDVAGLFRNARLSPGTRLEVTVTRRGFIGFRINYTVRARNVPKASLACLAAATSKPIRCPGARTRR